jgi:hypothetical protein
MDNICHVLEDTRILAPSVTDENTLWLPEPHNSVFLLRRPSAGLTENRKLCYSEYNLPSLIQRADTAHLRAVCVNPDGPFFVSVPIQAVLQPCSHYLTGEIAKAGPICPMIGDLALRIPSSVYAQQLTSWK